MWNFLRKLEEILKRSQPTLLPSAWQKSQLEIGVISLGEEGGGSTGFKRLWQGKLIPEEAHWCLWPQHPSGRRQKGSSLREADLKWQGFCHKLCLQPPELRYLPSAMVSSKAIDPVTFREARGFTLSFSLRVNEKLVLEEPQKTLKCGRKHPYTGNWGTVTSKAFGFKVCVRKLPMQPWVAGHGQPPPTPCHLCHPLLRFKIKILLKASHFKFISAQTSNSFVFFFFKNKLPDFWYIIRNHSESL